MHLTKMMMAYCKLKEDFRELSSHVAVAEPIIKLELNGTIYFSLTSSTGWATPPFYVLDRYKLCIRHKRIKVASVVLLTKVSELQREVSRQLRQYELEVKFERPVNATSAIASVITAAAPPFSNSMLYPSLGNVNLSKARVNLGQIIHCDYGGELGEVLLASMVHKDLLTNIVLSVKLQPFKAK